MSNRFRLLRSADRPTTEIRPLAAAALPGWLEQQPEEVRAWIGATGFAAESGQHCLVPGPLGTPAAVLLGVDDRTDAWSYAGLPTSLPKGPYRLAADLSAAEAQAAALGWALGTYAFDRYRPAAIPDNALVWPDGCDAAEVERLVDAVFLVRDLVNTPANDLGPSELQAAVEEVGARYGAHCEAVVGDALLERGLPAVHAVGRAAAQAPRVVRLAWGSEGPRIALIGKGVCFDSGGLDIKPSQGMLLMKKDMGGAAHALALAQLVMSAGLPLRLTLIIPMVENAIAGNAFRPGDVLRTRKGSTVEVGNTDAEGRLILCDALAWAQEDEPDLMLDFATLTGAARVALGPELPALFCNADPLARALESFAAEVRDPLWRLPLHQPYRQSLRSRIATLNNVSDGPFAGAITAALFLQHFVDDKVPWAHFDLFTWNAKERPGRPVGGEAMTLRACWALLREAAVQGRLPF